MKSNKSTCYQKKDSKLLLIKDCFRHKITNLLDTTSNNVPRFITKKWIEVHDQLGSAEDRYKPSTPIKFKTSMIRLGLCDFGDAYINVTRNITVVNKNNNDNYNRKLAFKYNAPFTACISKINGVLTDIAEDLKVVMPMYNLLEYSKNYEKITGSLWNYYRDEPKYGAVGKGNEKITTYFAHSKSFNYKTKITGELNVGGNTKKGIKIVVP